MSLPRELRKAIERGDLAAVEDEWLKHLDESPGDIEHFVSVARSLGGSGEETRARVLLELVDDHYRKAGLWGERLMLMERSRELHPDGEAPMGSIIHTLEKIYEGQPSLTAVIDLVGLEKSPRDLSRTWQRVGHLEQMMQFELGTVVHMEGKGVGRIVEVNTELGGFKIDLDTVGEIRVGFKAAGKLLKALPEGHFLRRKVESPEELEGLKPQPLLEQLLGSYEGALDASTIKQALTGLVKPTSWSSWWTSARKHPQLITEGKGTKRTYRLADNDSEAGAAVLAQFETAKVPEKLKIYRKETARDAELSTAMSNQLIKIGRGSVRTQPDVAFAVAWTLERENSAPEDFEWNTASLIESDRDPSRWVPEIGDRNVRRAAYELVRKREDWSEQLQGLMGKEVEAKLLDYLAGELRSEDPKALDAVLDPVVGQPRRYPAAFVWAVEKIGGENLLEGRNPLRLFQLVTSVGDRPEFSRFKARLKKLVANTDCLATLLSRIDDDQAEAAEEALRRAHLEQYQRERLATALQMRFPSLRGEKESGLYATLESINKRRVELKRLLEEEIPANRKAIEVAREMGDLRENFEYKSARQRHEYLSARATEIDNELRRVQPINFEEIESNKIRVGAHVTMTDQNGDSRQVTILGPWESNPEDDIVSYESDLAKELLGLSEGDIALVFGDELRIEKIESAG